MLRRALPLLALVSLMTLSAFGQNPPPTLLSMAPAIGSTAGGTTVTLTGVNFQIGAMVMFGNAAATNVAVTSSTSIELMTPANTTAGLVSVVVVNPDGQTSVLMPLANPGYELGSAGWSFAGTGSDTITTNSTQAHSGQNFAQLVSPASGDHPYLSAILSSGNSVYLPVSSGDQITFGGWAARLTGNGTVHWVLQVSDANKLNPVYSTTASVTSNAWTFQQNTYTIPSTGRFARFYNEVFGNSIPGSANYDDAVFIYSPKSTLFNYQTAPTISWIGPNNGPANTANPVNLSGTNFVAGDTVTFGGIKATNVVVVNNTSITAKTPVVTAGAALKVVVTSPSGVASSPAITYTFNPAPTLSSVSPSTGPLNGGASVIVSGSNFLPGARLTVGGVSATNLATTPGSISATTPPGAAGPANVVVTNPDGQSVTATAGYSYAQPAPTVAGITPASGSVKGGTSVTLTGANFLNSSVTFGGVAAKVTSVTATTITATAPACPTTGAVGVTVTNSDGQNSTLSGGFDYVAAGPTPTVTSISSTSGPTSGGANVTIRGTNFVTGATVMFGNAFATDVTVASSTSITATTPPQPAGPSNVTVTNPDGQSVASLGSISLLPNGGFENGAVDWKFVGSGSGTVVVDPVNAESGNNYALVTSAAGGPGTYYATDSSNNNQYFPVTTGDVINYGGGAFRLSGDGSTNYTLVVTDINKNVLTTWRTNPVNATNPVWTNMQGTYTIPAGSAFIRLGLQIRGNTVEAQVRFDNASFVRNVAGSGYTYVGPSVPGVYTYHYDNLRSGVNSSETILTPANVTQQTFGKIFTFPVDGWIDGEPLYVANVNIGGGLHNVVYVATEHDSVYAFDADGLVTGPLWQTSFLTGSGVTTVPTGDLVMGGFRQPEFGVMATPVIDPVAGTIFVLARSLENGAFVQKLHALDITTGAERTNSPMVITASVPGTGAGSINGVVSYDGYAQNVRSALSLVNGTVYFAAASLEDLYNYHGWVMAYDSQSLQQVGAVCLTPDGERAGVWQSGAGMGADAAGNIYLETGNGTFNANFGGQDYGDAIVKLQLSSSGLNVADYFTPWNQAALNVVDWDLASGAAVLLPDLPGPFPHEMIGGGKEGTIYVVNRDAMGGFNATADTQIVQELKGALTPTVTTGTTSVNGGLWNLPMDWNGVVYFVGRNDVMKAFSLQNGMMSTAPIFKGNTVFFVSDAVISSNPSGNNGILWVSQSDLGIIHAFNPYDLRTEYYNTGMAGTRDVPDPITRFMVPTVVNGKVYVGTKGALDIYGLLP
jgi:hypothetical protein